MINLTTDQYYYNKNNITIMNQTSPSKYEQQQQQHQTPIKLTCNLELQNNSNKSCKKLLVFDNKLMLSQSPLNMNSFKLGTIAHQSSPYIRQTTNYVEQNNDDDYDKPKVFQVEDASSLTIANTTSTSFTNMTSMATVIVNNSNKCDNLNLSSQTSSPSIANNETSFCSSQTKSSLKSSSTTSSSMLTNSKHVKFRDIKHTTTFHMNTPQSNASSSHTPPPLETPMMLSRCSSLTSLNSFDAKSIHSSVASEYSRRPSGIMSPSDLPDSPDESYIQSLRNNTAAVAASTTLTFSSNNLNATRLTCDSKSNEITMIERTLLAGNGKSSGPSSEKNSFYNYDTIADINRDGSISGDCGGGGGSVKDQAVSYDVEDSPWASHLQSEVSSLSAITFNDEINENCNNKDNNNDYLAILSLLQTKSSKEKTQIKTQQIVQPLTTPTTGQSLSLAFTPPIKLPASTRQNDYYGYYNYPTTITSAASTTTTTTTITKCQTNDSSFVVPASSTSSLNIDIPKLYCDEYTPSNVSPQSSMSELSVPSLVKYDIQNKSQPQLQQQQQQQQQYNNFNLLFNKLNLNKQQQEQSRLQHIQQLANNHHHHHHHHNDDQIDVVDLDVPKVYKTEDNNNNKYQQQQQNSINDTDSPKVFLTEDTPMCYSRSSSLNSLNDVNNVTAKYVAPSSKENEDVENNNNNDDDNDENSELNKSSGLLLLLSDSCNKPTNTPAGFVNMSRASYNSNNESENEDDEGEDECEGNDDDDDDDDGGESNNEHEEHDKENRVKQDDNEDVLIKQFINQTMPSTGTIIKSANNSVNNNNNSNIDDDEMLLQNFIKEIFPVPVNSTITATTRKSLTSKVPVPVVNTNTSIVKRLSIVNKDENTTQTHENNTVKTTAKKRLSEDSNNNSNVTHSKSSQHMRNYSLCMNTNQPQSPKLNTKSITSGTLKLTQNTLNNNKFRKITTSSATGSVNLTQTTSTYSLSTITSSSSTCSSSSNSVTANGQHVNTHHSTHHHHHHAAPVVNMTRTAQLRVSKLAEAKRKLPISTSSSTACLATVTTSITNTTSVTTRNPKQQQQRVLHKPSLNNIPIKTQENHHLESINESNSHITVIRRKSFHGATSIQNLSKKPLTLISSNKCDNSTKSKSTTQNDKNLINNNNNNIKKQTTKFKN